MPYPQASPIDTGEVARDSVTEGAPWAMFDFYRERVAIGSGAPIVTPTACHFPRLGRGKLIYCVIFFRRERISPLNHRNILIP